MQTFKKQFLRNLTLILCILSFFAYRHAIAETDHSASANAIDQSRIFRGIFYGYLPCNDCGGIRTTLSLKQNNNYLLVTQQAKASSREMYEKGKYSWDDKNRTVILTPRKQTSKRQYYIENEATLVQLNQDGARITGDEAGRYILRSSDTLKSRDAHAH